MDGPTANVSSHLSKSASPPGCCGTRDGSGSNRPSHDVGAGGGPNAWRVAEDQGALETGCR